MKRAAAPNPGPAGGSIEGTRAVPRLASIALLAGAAAMSVACAPGAATGATRLRPPPATGAAELSSSTQLVCARMRAGGVQCWGRMENGIARLPQELLGFEEALSIEVGLGPCARLPSGAVRCLRADGTEYDSVKLRGAEAVALRVDHEPYGSSGPTSPQGCARFRGNEWRCWDALTTYDAVPLRGATSVMLGPYLGCSLDGRGRLRCWGRNIGDGSKLPSEVPTRILDE